MPRSYWIYGIHLTSEIEIPGALLGDLHSTPTLRVRIGQPLHPDAWRTAVPVFRSHGLCANGQPAFAIEFLPATGWYRWRYCDGVIFCVRQEGDEVWGAWPPGESHQCAAYYLVGPILAFMLRRRGALLLHGSAVSAGGHAATFLGPSGIGKSTLAAALSRRGYSILADDLSRLDKRDGRYYIAPGYAGLRLWGDSAETLYGDLASLPRLVENSSFWPTWDKRFLDLESDESRFMRSPTALGAIYLLTRSGDPPRPPETISPSQGLIECFRNLYQGDISDTDQRRRDLGALSDVMGKGTPVRRAFVGPDLADLDRACDLLIADLSTL